MYRFSLLDVLNINHFAAISVMNDKQMSIFVSEYIGKCSCHTVEYIFSCYYCVARQTLQFDETDFLLRMK